MLVRSLRLSIIILLSLLGAGASRAQTPVIGQPCPASGLSGITAQGTPVICTQVPGGGALVWTATGGPGAGSFPTLTNLPAFQLSSYLANPTVPAQVHWDCSWSTGGPPSTITCPSGTFTSSMTGWVAWATKLDPGGNASTNPNYACGTQGTNPILTYSSSTTATLNVACSVASSGGSGVGGYAFVFGPDETSAVDTWILAVANACGVGVIPSGIIMTKHGGGGWNLTSTQGTNCTNATGMHSRGPLVIGQGMTASTIAIEPAFDFTTCTGGPSSSACFGSAQTSVGGLLQGGYSFQNWSLNGFGQSLAAGACCKYWVEVMKDRKSVV